MRIFRWFRRENFDFEHINGESVTIVGRNLCHAEGKLRAAIQDKIYGPWAFTYSPSVVEKRFNEFTYKPNQSG